MDLGAQRAVQQLADYLSQLVAHLDPAAGWYAEFRRRDPDGLDRCLRGEAIPPWDVLESLLQDLAVLRGDEWAQEWTGTLARLRADAVVAHDRQPGVRPELRARLAAAEAQRAGAEQALAELSARLRGTRDPAGTEELHRRLSWAEDDFARAAARCAEFGARLAAAAPEPGGPGPTGSPTASSAGLPAAAPAAGSVTALVGELVGLRAAGRSGEAHVLLCEAALWPPDRLPPLAAELERAGLGADWATLLWEAASLPPDRLSAVAAALAAAGRPADGGRLLREGVSRPAAEIADAALALTAGGRDQEAGALLGAFVRVRAPEESARLARTDPSRLAPRLLAAAKGVSDSRHRDLVHALRVAGVPMA
ncbi:hypothetical protein [Streptomyces sp. NPDC089919]|uniref:hypothetical protein n=1 Tax=Streptomyces sp. NPDC089919 TaxID=3155188 RepID=UPI00341582AA